MAKKATITNGRVDYGTGSFGGKYMGSNTSNFYRSVESAPGSTGYETGTVRFKNGTVNGVLPLGTSFEATGGPLADAQNVPDSSGVFAYAKGRTPGYLSHVSGYTGYGYQDAKGNFYDEQGNYLREDGYFYEPGAKISKNGKYQDTGSGFGHAGYSVTGNGKNVLYTKGEYYGVAPNTVLFDTRDWNKGLTSAGGEEQQQEEEPATAVDAFVSAQKKNPVTEWEEAFEKELARYTEEYFSGYNW